MHSRGYFGKIIEKIRHDLIFDITAEQLIGDRINSDRFETGGLVFAGLPGASR